MFCRAPGYPCRLRPEYLHTANHTKAKSIKLSFLQITTGHGCRRQDGRTF